MSLVDPRATIDPGARLTADIQAGPWSIAGAEAEIDEGTVIGPHMVLKGPTKIDKHDHIYRPSGVGEDTLDPKYKDEPTRLVIGDHNVIRRGMTIHYGAVQDRVEATIGDHNLAMVYIHISHDSMVGNHCIPANNMALAGYVYVGDWAILPGYTPVHQYCRIDAYSSFGMSSAIGRDVPAYVTIFGNPAEVRNMNLEGMCRRDLSSEAIHALRRVYKVIYRQGCTVGEALVELAESTAQPPEVTVFCDSIQSAARGTTR